jgi:hypothetical protein
MPALQNDAMTQIPETLNYYMELRTEAEDPEEWFLAELGATISKDINTWCAITYTVKEMTALKRYSLDRILSGACHDGKLDEGSKEVPESITRFCLFAGGKSMVEDFSMVLAKHCSDLQVDKKNHHWKFWLHLADYMVPVQDRVRK